jgi:hypothetical protein
VRTERETAGPFTPLRSGRDDKFFAGNGLKSGRMNGESEGKSSGIPHLAKNERDVGHPSSMREGSKTSGAKAHRVLNRLWPD